MAYLLEIAFGEKKKSTARKRAYLAREFPERVTEVISAFSGRKCPLCPGELCESHGSFLLTGSEGPTAENTCDSDRTLTTGNWRVT